MISMFRWVCLVTIILTSIFWGDGWQYPGFGRPIGFWEASVGVHAWSDHLVGRNLQWRHTSYIRPGVRGFTVVRGNNEFDSLSPLSPEIDELFLEHLAFYRSSRHAFSYSMKWGKVRYLRFPYPDRISMFDQVPGTEDLRNVHETGYAGALGVWEYEYRPIGIGHHLTSIQWMGNGKRNLSVIENYWFIRQSWHWLHWESRLGQLAVRPEPLGRSKWGHVSYLGASYRGYEAGFLLENLDDYPIYVGVMVKFALSPVTRALGSIHFDYTRQPQGVVAQIPFWHGYWGTTDTVPTSATLIGEVTAERAITYWQNGQGRNFYEHLDGDTNQISQKNTLIVVEEGPWHLKLESLVSPHSTFKTWDDFQEWERKRQGPAQLAQKVTYKVYQLSAQK